MNRSHPIRMTTLGIALAAGLLLTTTGRSLASPNSLRSYQTANGLLSRGLHELAIPEYRAFLEANATHEHANTARYGLGVCLHRTGEYAAAVEAFSEINAGGAFEFAGEVALLSGDAYLRLGRFDDAARALSEIHAGSSRATARSIREMRVEALHRAGKHAEAARLGRDLLQGDDSPRVRLLTGLSRVAMGDDAGAVRVLAPVLRSSGTGDAVREQSALALGQACQRLGEDDKATLAYGAIVQSTKPAIRVPAILGAAQLARATGDDDRAGDLLESLNRERLDPEIRSAAAFELGLVRYSQGRDRDALRSFADVRTDDLVDDAAYWAARSNKRLGELAEARRGLRGAIASHPGNDLLPQMRYELGVICLEQGDQEEALASFDEFLDSHPGHTLVPEALHASASAAVRIGEYEDAAARCERFERIAPRHRLAPDVALLHAESARQTASYENAVRLCSGFLRAWPEHERSGDARFIRGMSLASDGEAQDAARDLRAVTDTKRYAPKYAPALFALAQLEFQAKHWTEAERLFGRYVSDRPGGKNVHDAKLRRGLSLARLDDHEGAIEALQALVRDQAAPTEIRERALFEYGQSKLALGKDADASRAFEQVLAQAPESEAASIARRHLGDLAMRAGDATRAGDLYAKIEDDGTGSNTLRIARASLLAGNTADASARLERLLAESGAGQESDLARALLVIALSRQGEHARLLRETSRISRPQLLPLAERRAVILAAAMASNEIGDRERAAHALRELVDEDSSDSTGAFASVELASFSLDDGEPRVAIRSLDAASSSIEQSGDLAMTARAAYIRAAAWHRLGEHERVIDALDGFADRFPESGLLGSASLLLGDSYFELGRHRQAVAPLEQASRSEDDAIRSPAMLRLGESHAASQNWRASLASYESHTQEFPEHDLRHESLFGIARALENTERYRDAEAKYREVVEMNTGELAAHALFQIGECAFAQGEHERAVREFLRVDILFAYDEWSAAALYEAGRCFEQMNKAGDARAQYRAVVDRYAESSWAVAARERLGAMSDRGGLPGRRMP